MTGEQSQNLARANALQRIDQAGPLAKQQFVAQTYPQGGAVAVEYDARALRLWADRLANAGWSSWQDAVDWALENNQSWTDIATRLGVPTQSARSAGMSGGAVLPPKWQRMLALAEKHVAETGTLLDATGALAEWLYTSRNHLKSGDAPLAAASRLDQLDPDWRLDHAARIGAAYRRGITTALLTGSPFPEILARIRDAGFDDATAFVRWAVTTGQTWDSMETRVGIRGDQLARLLTDDNPVDPFAATAADRTSTVGHLGDNGLHVQCHDCGIWFQQLSRHIRRHHDDDGQPLTAASYRKRHHLPEGTPLSSTGHRADRPRGIWAQRLDAAGFTLWSEALKFAAENHVGPTELGELLGARGDAVANALKKLDPSIAHDAVAPYQRSVFGTIATTGDRSQCHECGLWFSRLGRHVATHRDTDGLPFTYDRYRHVHGLTSPTRVQD